MVEEERCHFVINSFMAADSSSAQGVEEDCNLQTGVDTITTLEEDVAVVDPENMKPTEETIIKNDTGSTICIPKLMEQDEDGTCLKSSPPVDDANIGTPEHSPASNSTAPDFETQNGHSNDISEVGASAGTDELNNHQLQPNINTTANHEAPSSNCEGFATADAPVGEIIMVTDPVQSSCYCLAKLPCYIDPELTCQMMLAQGQEAQMSSGRDAVFREYTRAEKRTTKLKQDVDAAEKEVIVAKDRVKAKRMEMDSVHLLVKLAKDAMTIEELDSKIREMEINQEDDEAMSPSGKKKLISEMAQASQLRDELRLAVSKNQQGADQALEEKEKNEERLKVLIKEHSALKEWASNYEEALNTARNKHEKQKAKLTELFSRWQNANHLSNKIFTERVHLHQRIKDKVQQYNAFQIDQNLAYQYAAAGDNDLLQQHCFNQVEAFMSKWNNSKEFRDEYLRCNSMSTVKRFGTMDGRSRGRNEVPALVAYIPVFTPNHNNYPSPTMAPVVPKITTTVVLQGIEETSTESDQSSRHKIKLKNVVVGADREATPVQGQNDRFQAGVKIEKEAVDVRKEKGEELRRKGKEKFKQEEKQWKRKGKETLRNSEEEEEHIKGNEEELTKSKEEAARLKEKHRLEEKIKAQKALERKGKMAEKAQARADRKAREEAQLKEREREKRANKKMKKKKNKAPTTNAGPSTTPTSETDYEVSPKPQQKASNEDSISEEPEIKTEEQPIPTTTKQRSVKPARQTIKSKTIPSPPPHVRLNNAARRRMMIQQVVCTFLTLMVLSTLFFLANDNFLVIRKLFRLN